MTAPNPLVTAPEDASSRDGAGIVDSMWQTWDEFGGADAPGTVVQGAGASLDSLGAIVDPLGTLAAAGVGWLIEHCEPLRWPLDQLAGDPQAIEAVSQTWHNIAAEMRDIGFDIGAAATNDTAGWHGQAADAYRHKAAELAAEIGAMDAGASGVAGAVATGGVLVGVFRGLIRDLVAECIGQLISKALIAAASSVVTLGGSVGAFIAWAVGKIGITIGKIAAKISELLATLGELLGKLGKLGGQLGELATHAARYANVRAVKMDDLASAPGQWVASGGPERLGDLAQQSYGTLSRRDEAVSPTELRLLDDAGTWKPRLDTNHLGDDIKAGLEAAKGAEKAEDDYERQRRQAREGFGD
ncbi:MAG: WXG100 family type VII secretion target [Pseudonocardiaceae bacterium]